MDPELESYHKKVERDLHEFRKGVEKDLMEWRGQISKQIVDISTDTRSRLARAETERDNFYKDSRFHWTEMSQKLDKAISLAEATNGRVNNHDDELYGPDRRGGLRADTRSLLDARLYVTIAAGFIATAISLTWFAWGSEIKERGILNKTDKELSELIEREIWRHKTP